MAATRPEEKRTLLWGILRLWPGNRPKPIVIRSRISAGMFGRGNGASMKDVP
jgi:hypothetical protein